MRKRCLSNYPDLQKHGVYAVTLTYSATNLHINARDNTETTVVVGFKVGATGAGHADPKASWTSTRSSNGGTMWSGKKPVVFFTGVKTAFSRFLGARQVREAHWRGPDKYFIVDGLHGEDGTVWG
jgi:hypothetical protein